jgi:glycosyltransferase involved in cell wall biosynthesis
MGISVFLSVPRRLTPSSAWHQHIPFAMFLIDALKPGIVVELGTREGDSYCVFCQAVQELKLNTRCFAVSTWKGDEQAGFFGSEVLDDLRAHHDPLYGSFSQLLQSAFIDALPYFGDGTVDLLHIDGFHTYEAAKRDFESWLPKMSRRGVVLLHNTNVRERNFGVWRFWAEIRREYSHFEFLHGRGLGVIGVGKDQPAAVKELFQSSDEALTRIRDFFLRLGESITIQIGDEAERERLRLLTDEKEKTIYALKVQLTEKDILIKKRDVLIREKEQIAQIFKAQCEQMQSSRGWRALQHYYLLRDTLLLRGDRGRNALRFLWPAAASHPVAAYEPATASQLKMTHLSLPLLTKSGNEEPLPQIENKISVVIPTKNGGIGFQQLLRKLKVQKGLRECEIIVVDSGSTDGTLQIAKDEGAVVVEIPPESFSHSFSRNKGAERATGDYILFTVQDACPLTDRWLWEMATALEQNNLVAVSCAEYPRSDSDLFYQLSMWNHYRSLNIDRDRLFAWDESRSHPMGLRFNVQISDIAALIRRDVFDLYKYRTNFAEDLDLGVRLFNDLHRIGFLYNTRVLHSHIRTPCYFLKRAYVDTKFLRETYPDFVFPPIDNQAKLFQDIAAIYHRTNQIASALADLKNERSIDKLMPWIRGMYSRSRGAIQQCDGRIHDSDFDRFVQSLVAHSATRVTSLNLRNNALLPHFLHHFKLLETFVERTYQIADEALIGELIAALYKIIASRSGTHLAFLYLTLSGRQSSEQLMPNFDAELSEGI